ncbi:hypothetical protein GGH93_005806 [Coemansia aciculifera]|nr:hypothetical protein GGH93_005806 [Coemansia aciculifera]
MQPEKEEYDVDRIIGRRISLCRGTEYLILWCKYTLEEASWEPSKLLDCDQKVEEFEQRCYQQRVEQQSQPDLLAVDLYEDHGLVTLVDKGHEYMADCDSGFEVPPEDFDFVGDGSVSNNHASGGQVRAALRDQAVGTTATHGWHRLRRHAEESARNSQSPTLARSHAAFEPLSAPTYSSFLLHPSSTGDTTSLVEITRICGTISDNGGRVYYLVQWSDQALSWEAPSAFVRRKEVELLTHFGNSQFAQERRHLGQELLSGLTNGKVGLTAEKYTGKVGMGGSANGTAGSSDAAQWFNLESSTLAPIAPDSLQPPASPAAKEVLARRIVESDAESGDEETSTKSSSSARERSSSADSGQPLLRAVKRRRARAPALAASAISDDGVDSPLARRMAQLCSAKPAARPYVFVRHYEGEVLERHAISRTESRRIERERGIATEGLQRAMAAPAAPTVGGSDVVARGLVSRIVETPPATPAAAPPPVRRPAERKACCVCQVDTRPDAWGCVECGLWFHRECYRSLATRLGAGSEYLSALDDYDDDEDFVCRFCSLHSRRTPQEFLTWRGTAASNRVNMGGVDILVKWKGVAYRHLDWVPYLWLQAQPDMRQKSMALKLRVSTTPEPPRLEDTFEQAHLLPAAIIGVKHCAPETAKQRLAKLREDPPAGVPEDAWPLYTTCESVWVVWRGLGASDATWEAPPSPGDAGPEYCAWHAEYVAWQQAETVSLLKHLQLAKKSASAEFAEYERQPEFIRGGTLYPYQMAGANWLWRKWHWRQSVVLADEMGLGKTVQVIAFLLMVFHSTLPAQSGESNLGTFPFLIVAPTTLISNWAQELRTWAPGLVVAQLSGRAADREIELEHTIFRHKSGSRRRDLRCHVVLASYEAVANQTGIRELTTGIAWQAIVYDEGHRLKNGQAKTYKALSVFNARMRVVLTGTPVQNDLRELSNILSFVDPANKELLAKIEELFADGSPPKLARVHSLIDKYFLRRTKSDVPCLVPAKHEVIVPVSMTRLQRELYRATLSKNVRLLQSIAEALHRDRPGGSGERVGSKSLNNVLLEVRQIVSHPYLVNNAEPKFDSHEETHAQLISACGKLSFLHALLPELRRRGHRALVFTQFKRTLDVLEDYLSGEGIGCVRIDGDTPTRLRQTAVNQFNAPGSPLLVFLASTRTGGTGLNLTSADVVIIYDCDFNPQADIQAIARAHRIGQPKPVTVLKLVTENSAEERIVRRATRKLLLDHLIMDNMAPEKAATAAPAAQAPEAVLPQAQMEADLRCDARTLFDEAAEVREIVYDSQRVAALLDQCQAALAEEKKRLETSDPATRSAFGVARVWAMDRDGCLDDVAKDPESLSENTPASGAVDVWARLLEQKTEVPADGDIGMSDAEGSGPRLRARKQKVDYGIAVAAEDVADGDDAVDARDDDYVDVPPTPVASVTVVQRNELVDVVSAHVRGVVDNYKASERLDGPRRPSDWDAQVRNAFIELCNPPLPLGNVQLLPPMLLFSTPTDLRLPRGTQLPPQPPLYYPNCPICRGSWHGTGYCPRICDPQLTASVAKMKGIQGYWAHPFFHEFVFWYSFQYIWFVLGDPRGPAVNEHNIATYRSYVCSAERYCQDVRAERRRREDERLPGIVVEAGHRAIPEVYATREYSSLCDNTLVCDELAVDVSDVGQDLDVAGDIEPGSYALEGLDGPVYTDLLANLHSQGHYLPTDVDALGPKHLPALLKARSNLRTFCLYMRECVHAGMNPHARGPLPTKLPPKLWNMATKARLFALHGHVIDRRIAELRALAPDGVDRIVVDTTAAQNVGPVETLFSMDVDEPEPALEEETTALESIPEEVVEVPEPAVPGAAPTETCSDSVVPIDGQFDETPSAHGIRMAVGKLSQARSLMVAARNSGEEPTLETKQSLMAAISDARTLNLRELMKAVSARPQLHGLLPMVRRLAEIQADPCSGDLEMTKALNKLVELVKAHARDVRSVAPVADGSALDTSVLASAMVSPPVVPGVENSTVHAATTPPPVVASKVVHLATPPVSAAMPKAKHQRGVLPNTTVPNTPSSPVTVAPPHPPLPVSVSAALPKTVPLRLNSPNATVVNTPSFTVVGAGTAQASPVTIAPPVIQPQRQQAPPLRVVMYSPPAVPNMAAASRAGVEPRGSTPSLLSTHANSRQTLAAATLASIVSHSMSGSPPQQEALPTLSAPVSPSQGQPLMQYSSPPVLQQTAQLQASRPSLAPAFPADAFADSRRSSLTPNMLGLLITPITGTRESSEQQQPMMLDAYNRQLSVGNASWQLPPQYPVMHRPPMYVERVNAHLPTTDMSCVICEDPVHMPANCPFASNMDYLTERRLGLKKDLNLPPNLKAIMLSYIDECIRKALSH